MRFVFALLCCVLLGTSAKAGNDFGYGSEVFPNKLLSPWIAESYGGTYTAEWGDGQGTLIVKMYYRNEKAEKREYLYSGCLIGPNSIMTRPSIRPFEAEKIVNGILKTWKFTGRFMQFTHPDDGKLVQGIVIDGLFFEQKKP